MELDLVVDVVAAEAQHHARHISIPASLPAAGVATVSWQVPASTKWRVHSLYVELTTSAVVANRGFNVQWKDQNGSTVGESSTPNLQVAGLLGFWTFAYGAPLMTTTPANHSIAPMPLVELPEGWSINAFCRNCDVADQLANAILVVDVIPSRTVPRIDRDLFEQL